MCKQQWSFISVYVTAFFPAIGFLFVVLPSLSCAGTLTWDINSHRSTASGSDIWTLTTTKDGTIYTAWGDGSEPGCGEKVSYGFAMIDGGPGSTSLRRVFCGPSGGDQGKIGSLIAVGNNLYGRFNTQKAGDGDPILYSTDSGKSWKQTPWKWSGANGQMRGGNFLNYGPGNAGAPGGYVYQTFEKVRDSKSIYLGRVPEEKILDKASYEFFSGTSGEPAWAKEVSRATPIITRTSGTFPARSFANIVYNRGLDKYIMAFSPDRSPEKKNVYEAPAPWGPWEELYSSTNWLNMGTASGGEDLGIEFPVEWISDGGKTMWGVFSCWGCASDYHDKFNVIRAEITGTESDQGNTATRE